MNNTTEAEKTLETTEVKVLPSIDAIIEIGVKVRKENYPPGLEVAVFNAAMDAYWRSKTTLA